MMLSALRPRSRRRGRGQRGAVAVEAALVTPVLIILVFGIIEFALIMRDYVAVSSAVRVGARIASANAGAGVCSAQASPCTPATSPALTQQAADAIRQAGTAMPKDSIDYIFVYQANKNGYPAPAGTASASIPSNTSTTMPSTLAGCASVANCVAYKWVDASDKFAYQNGAWDTTTINACPTTSYNVGVFMHATHSNITGFFGKTIGLGDRTVMKFEPLATTVCQPSQHQ
jgi:hypothetical protein